MATKIVVDTELAGGHAFPAMLPDPPRTPDMQQEPFGSEIRPMLRRHFAHRPDVLVSGEGYLCYDARSLDSRLVPDCLVAFGVNPGAIRSRNGYVISDVGKPPDLVLEIASESTGRSDYTHKRDGYARYGVTEYWRFDATGGEYHDQPLAGDQLVDGEYQPVQLDHRPDETIWGHSPVVEFDLCWDNGRLRFFDPAAGGFLPNLAEATEERDNERVGRLAAEAELQHLREQLRRMQAE